MKDAEKRRDCMINKEDNRLIDKTIQEEDIGLDFSLRPRNFDEYIGLTGANNGPHRPRSIYSDRETTVRHTRDIC